MSLWHLSARMGAPHLEFLHLNVKPNELTRFTSTEKELNHCWRILGERSQATSGLIISLVRKRCVSVILFLLFSFALLFLLSFRSSRVPSESSKLQKLRHIMRDVIAIRHCVGAQQVHFSLCFRRWWRTRFFATLLSSFPRRASTASSASTPAFTRFSYFTRLVSRRLWSSKTPHAICYNTTA